MSDEFRLYLFDADGTLRRTTVPGLPCPNRPGEWELIPGVRERLARIEWGAGGARFGVATNQGGVGLGYLTLQAARGLLEEMVLAAFGVPAPPGSIEICPHAPHLGCACRKPSPEMLLRLMRRFGAAPAETLYVGDMDRDEGAARAAGTRFMWAHEFFGWPLVPTASYTDLQIEIRPHNAGSAGTLARMSAQREDGETSHLKVDYRERL